MNQLNELIKNGYEIYPVKNKIPLTEHGYKDATNDIATIKEWRSKFSNCQWALRLDTSDLMVIDIDNHTDEQLGTIALSKLSRTQQKYLLDCPIDRTKNGIHVFMRKANNIKVYDKNLKNGFEIKTKNIVIYDNFTKSINEAPEAPQFILDMLKPKNETQFNFNVNNNHNKARWAGKLINKIYEGDGLANGAGRNSFLNELSGFLFNKFTLADPDAIEYLIQLVNEHVFAEPLPTSEVNSVINSAIKKYVRENGGV